MARWIHEFRSTGERALADGERRSLVHRAWLLSLRRWSLGALALIAFFSIAVGISIALTGTVWGWSGALISVVALCYLLSWASAAERLALLHRRALRLGTVEEFRRVRGDETARRTWEKVGFRETQGPDEEEDEGFVMPANEYWRIDERFEESLRHSAGGVVQSFTAVGRDGAILWVEGRPVRRLLEPPVWEVAGS